MSKPDVAIAVFIKTPGLSPIKTRLAEGIGSEKAIEFSGMMHATHVQRDDDPPQRANKPKRLSGIAVVIVKAVWPVTSRPQRE